MMIKLIVSDFDGTLLPYGEREVLDSTVRLLQAAVERGVTVAVSSGRTYRELAAAFPTLAQSLWFIACDGAYYGRGGRMYYEKQIAREDLRLFDKNRLNGFSYILHGALCNYACGNVPAEEAARFQAVPVHHTDAVKEKIFKVTSFGGALRLPPYCGLRMHWDGGKHSMAQYVNRFADKGTALSNLQTRLMLTKFDTACIGDSGNDVAMMHNAKASFCVGERSQALRDACQTQVQTAEEALRALLSEMLEF